MKSTLIALSAIVIHYRCCEVGYPVKGILAGVIMGIMVGWVYETIKKASPDEHRKYGRRQTNGIKKYHGDIISRNRMEVKKGGGIHASGQF